MEKKSYPIPAGQQTDSVYRGDSALFFILAIRKPPPAKCNRARNRDSWFQGTEC